MQRANEILAEFSRDLRLRLQLQCDRLGYDFDSSAMRKLRYTLEAIEANESQYPIEYIEVYVQELEARK